MTKILCRCSECTEIITEPICISCFEKQVVSWLHEQKISPDEKLNIKNNVWNIVEDCRLLPLSDFNCIICSKRMHNICNYCLMKETLEIITNQSAHEEIGMIFNCNQHDFGIKRI